MRSTDFYDLVSGRRRGVLAAAARAGLATAEPLYRVGVWWRNRQYDTRPDLIESVAAPVVSVGNLTLGGSGKTPTVKWLARRLRGEGVRVSIVSRGYGAPEEGGPNDEALELEQALPDVPHLQNRDRVAAARAAVEELAAQAVLADDGFQHRRLHRDLDIVLLDATEPFGFGRVFPRGALREPVASLSRADAVLLTRADRVSADDRQAIRRRVSEVAPEAAWCESVMAPSSLIGVDDSGDVLPDAPLEAVRDATVGLFSGIGNPAAFRATAESLGASVAFAREFADHHAYTADDIESLERDVVASNADAVLCTHKDLVKVLTPRLGGKPVWAVGIDLRPTLLDPALEERLAAVVTRAKAIEL